MRSSSDSVESARWDPAVRFALCLHTCSCGSTSHLHRDKQSQTADLEPHLALTLLRAPPSRPVANLTLSHFSPHPNHPRWDCPPSRRSCSERFCTRTRRKRSCTTRCGATRCTGSKTTRRHRAGERARGARAPPLALVADLCPTRDREDMRACWKHLDNTSRSFAAVIKELEGDLSRVVSRAGTRRAMETELRRSALHPRSRSST